MQAMSSSSGESNVSPGVVVGAGERGPPGVGGLQQASLWPKGQTGKGPGGTFGGYLSSAMLKVNLSSSFWEISSMLDVVPVSSSFKEAMPMSFIDPTYWSIEGPGFSVPSIARTALFEARQRHSMKTMGKTARNRINIVENGDF